MKNTEQLTLEDLAPYLPYRLKFYTIKSVEKGNIYNLNGLSFEREGESMTLDRFLCDINHGFYFPIMYPLSMLTQEIEHNGEKFVPQKELGHLDFEWLINAVKPHELVKRANYEDVVKLHEWHFWTGDQSYFDKGLIVDKSKM